MQANLMCRISLMQAIQNFWFFNIVYTEIYLRPVTGQLKHSGFYFYLQANLLFQILKKTEYLCLVCFFFNQFSTIKKIVFNKKFFMPHKEYRLSEVKFKKIFYFQSFYAKFWEFENYQFGHDLV